MESKANTSEEYDLVIIGAGASGSVLAHRLSSQSTLSILVLEAGENRNDDPNIYTPGLARRLLNNADYDWKHETEPEPGLCNRTIKHPRGKVVGGSSAINSFALLYPNRAGIDVWESMGNDGWNWKTLQPYFEKFQTVAEPAAEVRENLSLAHSKEAVQRTDGPLQTSFPPRNTLLHTAWEESWRALGLQNQADAFEGEAIGGHISVCHISAEKKERSHAGEAFLAEVADRGNLSIITEALVSRIVLSTESGTAVAKGVEYSRNGIMHHVRARETVILAAGSLSSPAILERSGIGDEQRLAALGIPLIYHSASVGENLQDHIRGALNFEAGDNVPKRNAISEAEARELYERDRSGPWAESACWTFAYMPLQPFVNTAERDDWNQKLQESLLVDSSQTHFERRLREYIKAVLSSPQEAAATAFLSRKPYAPVEPDTQGGGDEPVTTNWVILAAMLSHSLSSGSVHVTSRSPDQHPKIQCNYYSNEFDLEVHARIMKGLLHLAATEPLSRCIKQGGKREPPLNLDSSLDEFKAALRAYAGTNYHPVGTCSMLPEKSGGVVDSKLKVYGTENLYVVDASVMPVIPRANIITTVYAVAERAADILLEDVQLQPGLLK
jgi:choline dehydrogenase-like flavoprotein